MKVILSILFILSALFSAQARLGETEQQIETRYGKPVSSFQDVGFLNRAYKFRGFLILISFERGICRGETYEKIPATELLDADIRALLGANAGEGKWRQVPDSSTDRFVLTLYRGPSKRIAKHDTVRNTLMVTSEDFIGRIEARHAKELKGF